MFALEQNDISFPFHVAFSEGWAKFWAIAQEPESLGYFDINMFYRNLGLHRPMHERYLQT